MFWTFFQFAVTVTPSSGTLMNPPETSGSRRSTQWAAVTTQLFLSSAPLQPVLSVTSPYSSWTSGLTTVPPTRPCCCLPRFSSCAAPRAAKVRAASAASATRKSDIPPRYFLTFIVPPSPESRRPASAIPSRTSVRPAASRLGRGGLPAAPTDPSGVCGPFDLVPEARGPFPVATGRGLEVPLPRLLHGDDP